MQVFFTYLIPNDYLPV